MKRSVITDRIISAAAVVALMVLIFIFSAQNADASSHTSGSVIKSAAKTFNKDFVNFTVEKQDEIVASWQLAVRKTAHFSEYALLGFLTANALRTYGLKQYLKALLPPLICFAYAFGDELHQYFVPGRACRFTDMLIDTSGAIVGTLLFAVLFKLILKYGRRKMIRKLTENDRELYFSLVKEFYGSDAVLHNIPEKNIEATFSELMRSDVYTEGFVLETEGTAAGYALIAKTFSQEAGGFTVWIEELYVLPQYRSKGLGGEFFAYLEKEYPAARYRLEVEPENERAVALYIRKGFDMLEYGQMIKETE